MIDSIVWWCFVHPYLTFFMFCSLCAAIGNFKLITINKKTINKKDE